MNKDQFAYLNIEIKALESERDALKAERDQWKAENESNVWLARHRLDEISKLRADVEEERRHYNDAAAIRDDALVAMSKAESRAAKYREYLETIKKHEEIVGWDQNALETVWKLAQEALKEVE